jgi:ribonuclease III
MTNLQLFENKIKYQFSNKNLLKTALTHPSCDATENYERLEFLGDSVLNLMITEQLILLWPEEPEGSLAKRRSFLVSGEVLSEIAKNNLIQDFIIISNGEESMGGRLNPNNLENVLEALIGALYLDGGFNIAKNFITNNWQSTINNMHEVPINAKSSLQEWSQSRGLGIPEYRVINQQGPAHQPIFEIEVIVGKFTASANGTSKKEAETLAAKTLLQQIN